MSHLASFLRSGVNLLTIMSMALFVATLNEPAQAKPKKLATKSSCDCKCNSDQKSGGFSLYTGEFSLAGLGMTDCLGLQGGGCRIKTADGSYAAGTVRTCSYDTRNDPVGAPATGGVDAGVGDGGSKDGTMTPLPEGSGFHKGGTLSPAP